MNRERRRDPSGDLPREPSREEWRAEADDEWLAERRSDLMGWFRRRFGRFGGVGDAVSRADTGPYAGAPRDPRPRVAEDQGYAVVRYATDRIAYTATGAEPRECPSCGGPVADNHEIGLVDGAGDRAAVGAVLVCRDCQADSWMLCSRMPAAGRGRDTARRHVV